MSKKLYKRHDKRFETRRDAIFKRNRYIIIKIGDVEQSIKLPFNIMTADYMTDKDDNIIKLDNKTKQERVEIYLKIEYDNIIQSISYDMTDYNKKNNDTRYFKYNDIEWIKTDDYYIKEQVAKYSTDKDKPDNIISVNNQTTEDVVSDILNDMIGSIVMKEEFKLMVNNEIGIGGERDAIKADYDRLKNDEIDTAQENAHDTQFNILRPNIKIC